MDAVVRIQPELSSVHVPLGELATAQVNLGGIPRGGVLLLCASGTMESDAVEAMNGLAEHGYESIAADLTAGGAGVPDDATAVSTVRVLLDRLAERGWSDEQIGLVGYGVGGRIGLLAAAEYTLGAAVSVNPTGILGDFHGASGLPVRTPWLGMFGGPADRLPAREFAQFDAALWNSSPAFTMLVSYPGVDPDFYRNSRESLGHAAAFDCWQRIIEWLNGHVAPRPTPLAMRWRERHLVG